MPNETPTVETSTFALWPMDSDREDDFVVTDEKSQLTLVGGQTFDIPDGRPWIHAGSGANTRSRWSNGDRFLRQDDNGGPGAALLVGNWTMQFRMYLERLPDTGEQFVVVNYSSSGESSSTNNLLEIGILDTGAIRLFWEHSSGSNVGPFTLSSTICPVRTWFTLSARAVVSGGDRTVHVYIDNTQPDSGQTGTNASGGTNSDWGIMGRAPQEDRRMRGGMASIRISNVDLGDAQVKADASLDQFTDLGSSTWSLINFTDDPAVTDLAGNYHLMRADLYTQSTQAGGTVESAEGLICAGDRARAFTSSTDWLEGPNTHRIRDVFTGEWSLEFWFRHDSREVSDIGILVWHGTGSTEEENRLVNVYLDRVGQAWRPRFEWERGAGILEDHTATVDLLDEVRGSSKNHLFLHHIAFVFIDNSGTRDIKIFLDGSLIETLATGAALPTGGEDAEHLRFGISGTNTSSDSTMAWVHLHDEAIDDATVAAHYEAQRPDCNVAPPVDSIAPIVDNYDPAPGTAISNTDTVAFDVTDDTGFFCKIMITAYFADSTLWEVVHDGVSFSPRYAFGASRTPITNGFRYVVRRVGGWSLAPTIRTYAIDLGGNEAT